MGRKGYVLTGSDIFSQGRPNGSRIFAAGPAEWEKLCAVFFQR